MIAVILASLAVAGAAAADVAKVVVPLSCAVERGRLAVHPSAEKAHPIIGQRASHAFTTCAAGKSPRCRTFMVHKFDLSCDGFRVSWLGLVGSALEKDDPRVRVLANRFTLRMPPGWSAARERGGGGDDGIVSFPVGFAPSLKIPVRFGGADQKAPTVTTWEKPPVEERVLRVAAMTPLATGAPIATASTNSPVAGTATKAGPATEPATEVASWLVTVEPVAQALGTSREHFAGAAATVALAWLLLFAVRRRLARGAMPGSPVAASSAAFSTPAIAPPDTTDKAAAGVSDAAAHPYAANDSGPRARASDADTYAAHCARMIADAVSLHKSARDTLPTISHASLRSVLQDDLDKVQAVLLAPRLANEIAAGLWTSVEVAVTRALADLDRIGRIIESVTSAGVPSAMQRATATPETASDAYELLGVTPEASAVAVKKIVDGLRLSWHPDHAKDETDRNIRETRLKQINVAWDLIQGQQKAA